MRPFVASAWKPEMKVVTRIGENVRILCVDAELLSPRFIVAGILDGDLASWMWSGRFHTQHTSPNDLHFADDSEVL